MFPIPKTPYFMFYGTNVGTYIFMDYGMDSLVFFHGFYFFDIFVLHYDYFYDIEHYNHNIYLFDSYL